VTALGKTRPATHTATMTAGCVVAYYVVSMAVEWIERRIVDGSIRERAFRLAGPPGAVSGVLWLPRSHRSSPDLILLGHGGSGHKRSERVVRLGRWFSSQVGLAALAIDGPC
jgi:hypothetical protein